MTFRMPTILSGDAHYDLRYDRADRCWRMHPKNEINGEIKPEGVWFGDTFDEACQEANRHEMMLVDV